MIFIAIVLLIGRILRAISKTLFGHREGRFNFWTAQGIRIFIAVEPRVFYRLTDNWIEMAARFLVEDHGIRAVKDKISRDILALLDEAKIGIASGTYEIVGMPELKVRIASGNPPPANSSSEI